MIRDLTPYELAYVDRETLAGRLREMQTERDRMAEDLRAAHARIARLESRNRPGFGHTAGCVAGVVCEPYCEAES